MDRLLLIDGNSIINRAFYGIMGNKMLMLEDGTYTNAVYGFLAILFKELEELKPEYLAIAFDVKAPTKRHKMYSEYKGTRHGMPDELAMQMPLLKDILRAMNIEIIEKEGYEADDILGTLAKWGQNQALDVIILTGDRDSFQLIDKHIKVRIPRTKMGKTETEDYDIQKIKEEYVLEPKDLIEVKGLMGDASDNIPGIPGVGEKTAINLIKEYKTIDNLYLNIEKQKGKLKEKIENNKELAYLSKELGTIDIDVPITRNLQSIKITKWDNEKVLDIFKKLKFNRFIERFELDNYDKKNITDAFEVNIKKEYDIENIKKEILETKKMFYFICEKGIVIYLETKDEVYYLEQIEKVKELFENKDILKIGYKQKETWVLLKKNGINAENLMFDVEIAGYLLNSNIGKYTIEYLAKEYLEIDINVLCNNFVKENEQMTLFDSLQIHESNLRKEGIFVICIYKLYNILLDKMKLEKVLDLFNNIEMPLIEVLASMQYEGIYIDKEELIKFGEELTEKQKMLTGDIYKLADAQFNMNSTKQLGEILFDKLKLPHGKKTKTGYSTDGDTLEKLKNEHPIINKILEYRQVTKLYSTYVAGLIPYINEKTKRIHSLFHQTVTSTGRISSTEPNLQNIPTRFELGQNLRKVFKPEKGKIFIDADYSQIELRILAHLSDDINMIQAFNNNEDIHAGAAAKVLNIPIEAVTKEERSKAKAINFGIVYGISDYGLAEQLGVPKKMAKNYIEQYLEKYNGIKQFMDNIVDQAKEQGFVETLYNRKRFIPELKSNNYNIRQFGARIAMNMPVQGTAADIMKIAMINVYNKMKQKQLKSKLILQIHDELLIETTLDEKEIVKDILKTEMESVTKLSVPLVAELSEGYNWYEAK